MPRGPLWSQMNVQPRRSSAELRKRDLPPAPGVYAWYRDGDAVYVGKADSLKDRLGRHLGRGRVMTSSAFRRNVAEHLGISTAALIKSKAYQPDDDEVASIRAFVEGCEVAWVTTSTPADALHLETNMKLEWTPPLTKM
jgi:excinuclease UvrABC nuclease subunit